MEIIYLKAYSNCIFKLDFFFYPGASLSQVIENEFTDFKPEAIIM